MGRLSWAFLVCGNPLIWGAERIPLVVTAVSHESQVTTGQVTMPGNATSNTSCNGTGINTGPLSTASVNCQTTTQGTGPTTVTTRRLDVRNVVEANGEWFTISCTANWALSNCSPMTDGDKFDAEYDGKTTMWISARKGGNLGKPITIKYHVLDRRPIPPGKMSVQATPEALRAAHDAEIEHQIQSEFPEIVEDYKRVAEGQPPQTELFKRAAEIYRLAIAEDPGLKNANGALLLAIRQAQAELAGKRLANATRDRPGVAQAPEGASLTKIDAAIPKGIRVRFTSAPYGAEVDVDGSYWGTTPTADFTRLPAGAHTIVVKKLGYKTWERKIDLAGGDDRTVNAELEIDPSKPHVDGL
jgi:hypothetical protein